MEIRLSDDERAQIEDRARANGVTFSRFLRHAALDLDLPPRRVNIEAETVAALNRVGGNLNQIAKAANRSGRLDPDQQRQLARAIDRVAAAVARLTDEGDTK
ncbi:plasmid mobilization protein [Alloyangia pacifica]|uniref:plasmid mobilization protein n=1 Tax=Alloyangia pacifica TaxID=311180 RepID=UPI0031E20AAF